MARTRADFLTRGSALSAGEDSDEDDYDGDSPQSPPCYTLDLHEQSSTEAGLGESCFSDSDMVTGQPSHQRPSLRSSGVASLLTHSTQRTQICLTTLNLNKLLASPKFWWSGRHFKNNAGQAFQVDFEKSASSILSTEEKDKGFYAHIHVCV